MKKLIITSIAAALLLSPVAAYADVAATNPPAAQPSFALTADISVQKADTKAFAEVKELFNAQTVDLAKVKAVYTNQFQAKVKALIPDTDAMIVAVLDGAIEGKFSAAQAKQAVDKGLQGYFYAEISNLTKGVAKTALAAGKKDEAKTALEQAIALYADALQGTVEKRDNSFGTQMKDQMATIIIPGLQSAVEKGDLSSFNVYRQMFDKTLIKTFVLATLTYAKKIPETAKTDAAAAQVGITEGYFFYLPIYNSLSGGHKPSADLIKAAFESGDASKVDTEAIKSAFLKALTGKISNYATKVLATDFTKKEDLLASKEPAMEGNMFLSIAEPLLKERIGEAAMADASAKAQAYFEAVSAGDKAKAEAAILSVLKTLSSQNGISFQIGASSLLVNGKEKKIDVPAFLQNGRTLVPARALAEALGGSIRAEKAGSQTKIVIEKDGSTVDFLIGSKEINKDGKKLDVSFDQPALIKSGRTFIPLRAVSQVFGQKVFFEASTKTVIVLN